jgi:calcineurin-like phosphoesterase family protein
VGNNLPIYIIGDVHWKEPPFSLGLHKFFDYLESLDPGVWIFTGDYYDSSRPLWDIHYQGVRRLLSLKGKKIIVEGNHDKYATIGSALSTLDLFDDIKIIHEKTEMTIHGINFLFLPYADHSTMKSYSDIGFEDGVIVTHFAPPNSVYGNIGEYDLPKVKNCKIYAGHIHTADLHRRKYNGNDESIIGVPQTTRQGEEGLEKYIVKIYEGKHEFLKLPTFFDIRVIEFGEEVTDPECIDLIKVINAPSSDSVYDMYGHLYLKEDGIKLKEDDVDLQTLEDVRLGNSEFLETQITKWAEIEKPDKYVFALIMNKLTMLKGA